MLDMTIVESKIKTLKFPETLNIDFTQLDKPNTYSIQLKTDPHNLVFKMNLFASCEINAYFRVVNNDNKVSYKGPYNLSKGRQQLREYFIDAKELSFVVDNGLNPGLCGVLVIENILV